jgi:hypothetical protein
MEVKFELDTKKALKAAVAIAATYGLFCISKGTFRLGGQIKLSTLYIHTQFNTMVYVGTTSPNLEKQQLQSSLLTHPSVPLLNTNNTNIVSS